MWVWDSSGDAPLRNPPYCGMLRTDLLRPLYTTSDKNDGNNCEAAGLRAPPYDRGTRQGRPQPTVGLREGYRLGVGSWELVLVVGLRVARVLQCGHQAQRLACDHAAFEQLTHVLAGAELGEDFGPLAGIGVVHHVSQHGRHHRSFLSASGPEPLLKPLQDRLERSVIPLLDRRIEIEELLEYRRVGSTRRTMPEGDVGPEVLDVLREVQRGAGRDTFDERGIEAADLIRRELRPPHDVGERDRARRAHRKDLHLRRGRGDVADVEGVAEDHF